MTHTVRYISFPTEFGPFYVAYDGETVRYTSFQVTEAQFLQDAQPHCDGATIAQADAPPVLSQAIQATLAGKVPFDGRLLDFSKVAPFHKNALNVTIDVPWGDVRPYGWLAKQVHAPRAARAVGSAMARNPFPLLIPCHRIVRSNYTIGNYGCGGQSIKRALLRMEGVDIDELAQEAGAGMRYVSKAGSETYCILGCSAQGRDAQTQLILFPTAKDAALDDLSPCSICQPA